MEHKGDKMKKLILGIMILFMFTGVGFCADIWDKDDPAGTANVSDIDTLITTNNSVLDILLAGYRSGTKLSYLSAATLSVAAGEVTCSVAAGTTRKWRRNTSATTVTWAMIDTGAEAASTTYYVYANADADATTFTVTVSTSSSAPTGVTSYKKLGSFYNDSSSNIERGKVYDEPSGSLKANSSGQGFMMSVQDYGSSTSSYTSKEQWDLRVAYGSASVGGNSSTAISNMLFTSAATYKAVVCVTGSTEVTENATVSQSSGSAMTIYNEQPATRTLNWIAIGY